MINREQLIIARNVLGNEFNKKENLELIGADEYSRLCDIIGRIDVLIKILNNPKEHKRIMNLLKW